MDTENFMNLKNIYLFGKMSSGRPKKINVIMIHKKGKLTLKHSVWSIYLKIVENYKIRGHLSINI